jgi:hypothetical protein
VYQKGEAPPLILPQILTGDMIRQALRSGAPAAINEAN